MIPKLVTISIFLAAVNSLNWNYEEDWNKDFPTCAGSFQSPINIDESTTVYDAKLADFSFFNYDQVLTWIIKNEDYSIVGNLYNSSTVPYIQGSDFTENYTFVNFHFHWGNNINEGSEHLLERKQFPLEIHIVHQSDSGTLAVLGFLFEISQSDNKNLDTLISVSNIKENDTENFIEYSLNSMIPKASELNLNGYFRYSGSLTIPPCSESVIWTVFRKKIPISQNQVEKFYETGIKKNFREIQKLN
ncbi:carbonic anhydrase 4-like, partial [Brachionus plicatilis]